MTTGCAYTSQGDYACREVSAGSSTSDYFESFAMPAYRGLAPAGCNACVTPNAMTVMCTCEGPDGTQRKTRPAYCNPADSTSTLDYNKSTGAFSCKSAPPPDKQPPPTIKQIEGTDSCRDCTMNGATLTCKRCAYTINGNTQWQYKPSSSVNLSTCKAQIDNKVYVYADSSGNIRCDPNKSHQRPKS